MAYVKKTDLKELVLRNPKEVVKVSVLEDRVNIKLMSNPIAQFYASLKGGNDKELTGLLDALDAGGATYVLYDRRGGLKSWIDKGVTVRSVKLTGAVAPAPPAPFAPSDLPKSRDAVIPLPAVVPESETLFPLPVDLTPEANIKIAPRSDGNVFRFENLEISKNNKNLYAEYVPAYNGYQPIDKNAVKQVIVCLKHGLPAVLEGHTGVGKTEMIRWLAHECNQPLLVIQGAEDMETSSLIGHMEIDATGTYWVDGLMTVAVREGLWIYFDEINACPAGIKIALHGLLDDQRYLVLADNKGERVRAHENFRFVSACNPASHSAYVGTGQENAAFMNRFCKVVVNYLPEGSEKKLLKEIFPSMGDMIEKLVGGANIVRREFLAGKIMFTVSMRDIKTVLRVSSELGHDLALSMIISKSGIYDRKAVVDAFEQKFSSLTICRTLIP